MNIERHENKAETKKKMNIIRRILLKLARGVAQEEVIHRQTVEMIGTELPMEKIKIGKNIGPDIYLKLTEEELIDQIKRLMAVDIANRMLKCGMVRLEIEKYVWNTYYNVTAEIMAVKWYEDVKSDSESIEEQ